MLAVPATHQIAVAVPRAALGGIDLASAAYGTAMFGNSEAGEGIGYVRPVYDLDYWLHPPAGMDWVTQFRFGGGAGIIDFGLDSKDTDTRDPNALDVIVGCAQKQSDVLNWRASSPSRLPMLGLGEPAACTVATGPVSGTVPATLSLTLGAPATFGAFTPGVEREYTATTTANVISTAGDAALTVSDPGHLTNGAFTLPEPLRVELSKAAWTAPVSNDPVTITFRQPSAPPTRCAPAPTAGR